MSNVGNLDRIVRAVLGIVLIIVPFVIGWTAWGIASAVVGAILVGTAAISFCPIYALLGLSSKRRSEP